MSSWKSRWSWERLVNAPTANRVPADPAEGERVAGDLHRHVRDAALDHHGEQRLQVGRLRRGERARQPLARDPRSRRCRSARWSGPAARRPALDQVGRGGLAGGAGDAEHGELQRRLAVDPRGERAEGRARVGVAPGRARPRRADAGRSAPGGVGEDGGGARRRRPGRRSRRRARSRPGRAAKRSPGSTCWARRVVPVTRELVGSGGAISRASARRPASASGTGFDAGGAGRRGDRLPRAFRAPGRLAMTRARPRATGGRPGDRVVTRLC